MISQTSEYALRAVVCLAASDQERLSTAHLARLTKVPAGYLSKTLQILARKGLVRSDPGRAGGFQLARSAQDITVLDVVNAVDPVQRIRQCPLDLQSHKTTLCPLHRRIDDAAAAVEAAFASTPITDLLGDPTTVRPLCEREAPAQIRIQDPDRPGSGR